MPFQYLRFLLLFTTEILTNSWIPPSSPLSRHRTLRSQEKKNQSEEEQWIASSIAKTMPPAAQLGIDVECYNVSDDGSLSLSMPLEGNTNVHGSAFAGSLYSVSALCAWYTLVCHLRRNRLDHEYTVVIKSAEIHYKRPVVAPRIITRCVLPETEICEAFLNELERAGKATLPICGTILPDEEGMKSSAVYTAVMCAFNCREDWIGGSSVIDYSQSCSIFWRGS